MLLYYQVLAQEIRQEAGRRNKSFRFCRRCLGEEDRPGEQRTFTNSSHQLSERAGRDPAIGKRDLERTVIRAPADGWVTNLNVYARSHYSEGSTAVRW